MEKNNEEEDELKDERILFAEGYGLKEILNMEGVKGSKTKSNHIMEI